MAHPMFFVVSRHGVPLHRHVSGIRDSWEIYWVDDAGSSWLHCVDRSLAGRDWWLVADFTVAGALQQGKSLARGYHPRQADIEWLHADIRAGLDFDPAPLTEHDPTPWRHRIGKMKTVSR